MCVCMELAIKITKKNESLDDDWGKRFFSYRPADTHLAHSQLSPKKAKTSNKEDFLWGVLDVAFVRWRRGGELYRCYVLYRRVSHLKLFGPLYTHIHVHINTYIFRSLKRVGRGASLCAIARAFRNLCSLRGRCM